MKTNLFSFYLFIILSTVLTAGLVYVGARILRQKFHFRYLKNHVIGLFILFLAFRSISLNILFYLKEIIAFDLYSFLFFHSVSQDTLAIILSSVPLAIAAAQKSKMRFRLLLTFFPLLQLSIRITAYFSLVPNELFNITDILTLLFFSGSLILFSLKRKMERRILLLTGVLFSILAAGYIWGETGLMLQERLLKTGLTIFLILNSAEALLLILFFPKRRIEEVDESLLEECFITGREREMILWAIRGYTNSEISEKLNISEKTVKNHFTSIYEKLGVRNRIDLFRLAVKS